MSIAKIDNIGGVGDLPSTISTFTDVQKVLNAHAETSRLSVGMEISEVTVGGEPMVWVIGAINHDPDYPHQVIFVPKWCLATTRQMNSTNTNVGGWNSSAMRSWLNGDFYNSLPSNVKPYIKDRTFQTSQGNQSTALQSATDKIWLPREYEVFGATTYAAATEHTDGDAEQFSIFATEANRIKTQGKTGAACTWWESSPFASAATHFCAVALTGVAASGAATNALGVLPCFHMTDGTEPHEVVLVDINPNKDASRPYMMNIDSGYIMLPCYEYSKIYVYRPSGSSTQSCKYKFNYTDGTESQEVNLTVTSTKTEISIPQDALGISFMTTGSDFGMNYSLKA